MSVTEYFGKMKALGDEMKAVGRSLDDEELVEYIITGLDEEYTPLVSALCARVEPISISELFSQLLNFETRVSLFSGVHHCSANSMGRGHGGTCGRGGTHGIGGCSSNLGCGGLGRGDGRGRGRGSNDDVAIYQVCGKRNHTAAACWHRYDESYQPSQNYQTNQKLATAVNSYQYDPNWYVDSGAIDHITGELEKLSIRNKYQGGDQIHTASGTGMNISYIGQTTFPMPSHNILLKDILYVPKSKKNLVSVHRLTYDNSVFLELHPTFFLVKDHQTKTILLKGRCIGGLYPIPVTAIKEVCSARRFSINTWHSCFGHPSFKIVEQVISQNNLLCSLDSTKESICNACQQAKSHQLPYPKSTSVSGFPLQLVYTNVWGPTPESVDKKKYYVSFIDDFSKFTWVYLIKFKFEVFQTFQEF
jgi:hypothetical protein